MKKVKQFQILYLIFLSLSCETSTPIITPPLPPQPPEQIGTWDFVGFAGENDISSIEVVPDKPWIIYVGFQSDFSSATQGKIFKSNDWGKTWNKLIDSISISKITLDTKNNSIIYAGLNSLNFAIPGVIKSTNEGSSWFRADSGIYVDWETMVAHLIIDPTNSNVLYAGTVGPHGGGLSKTMNGGQSWFTIPTEWQGNIYPLSDGVTTVAIDPKNPNELYVGTSWLGYLYKSYNAGNTFKIIYDTLAGLPACLEVNPYRSNVVYLGYVQGGFRRSTDHGFTWQSVAKGLTFASVQQIIVYSDSVLFACQAYIDAGGVYQTNNDGITWKYIYVGGPVGRMGIDRKNGFLYAAYIKQQTAGLYRYKIAK